MPHTAGYVTAILRNGDHSVQVLDAFGLKSDCRELTGKFMLMGRTPAWIAENLAPSVKICLIYCRAIAEFIAIEKTIKNIKNLRADVKICLFENPQAVTAFSLRHIAEDLHKIGADILIFGEPEDRICKVVNNLLSGEEVTTVPGISEKSNGTIKTSETFPQPLDPDELPFPAWEDFPLEGYWRAGFAHAPCKSRRFLPILTSRGCPFHCRFCIAPYTNKHWRGRSPENLVSEIEYFSGKLGVTEYHVSDLNPTVDKKRIMRFCELIIAKKLSCSWKLAQGTKIETLDAETIDMMGKAGCNYISFSPETGSARLLKEMNKPFDYEHALQMVGVMNRCDIRSQACFIAGLPGENPEDRRKSISYMEKLVDCGLDEIAVFGFTPIPGSELDDSMDGFATYSECTFNPLWRKDYKELSAFRKRLYLSFFMRKLRFPRKIIREFINFLSRRFETKMEMSAYKLIKLYLLRFAPALYKFY